MHNVYRLHLVSLIPTQANTIPRVSANALLRPQNSSKTFTIVGVIADSNDSDKYNVLFFDSNRNTDCYLSD